MRRSSLAVAVAFALAVALPAQAELYQWTDANGTVHFTTDLSQVPASQRGAAERSARPAQQTAPSHQPPASAQPAPSAARGPSRSGHTAETVALLRARLLERGPATQAGLDLRKPVYGVLMETGFANGAATLVALENGKASLYFSEGGGVLGGESVPAARAAAQRLTERAATHALRFSRATSFPLPAEGEVRFYLLTASDVRGASARRDEIARVSHPLHALFAAGHEVVTGMREASEAQAPR